MSKVLLPPSTLKEENCYHMLASNFSQTKIAASTLKAKLLFCTEKLPYQPNQPIRLFKWHFLFSPEYSLSSVVTQNGQCDQEVPS